MVPRKAQLKAMYEHLVLSQEIEPNESLQHYLVRKGVRSLSGVLVVTIFTSPYPKYIDPVTGKEKIQRFSCKHSSVPSIFISLHRLFTPEFSFLFSTKHRVLALSDCYYCPNEPDMPRSYLSDEPGVRRGVRHKWDAIDQFYSRCSTLRDLGHPIDKIEVLILGGTWSEYPVPFQEQFLRDIYWSANTFYDGNTDFQSKRRPHSLLEEQSINDSISSKCRIIGLTLETRPDTIDVAEIQRMRYYGCTRLQIGVQHTDDSVLEKINRGCTNADAVRAVRLLKNSGFKIDFHLMPDLPGSTPKLDREMIEYVLHSEELQGDQWKLYPTQTVPWTVIKKWNDEGTYTPYGHEELIELMIWIKSRVHPWIRLNRVIRDIPEHYISAGNAVTNLRQILLKRMKQRGLKCQCIRCREVGAFFRDTDDSEKGMGGFATESKEEKRKRKNLERKRKKMAKKERRRKLKLQEMGITENTQNHKSATLEPTDQRTEEEKMRDQKKEETERKKAEIVMKERDYRSSGGDERFISFERRDEQYIYGFVRLRLPALDWKEGQNVGSVAEFERIYAAFPELEGAALVRELHVYGQMLKVGDKKKKEQLRKQQKKEETTGEGKKHDLYAQHYGFGTKLMRRAEAVAIERGYKRIAVIAGIGTRAYYRKLGYSLKGTYMVKELSGSRRWIRQRVTQQTAIVAAAVIVAVGATYWMFRSTRSKADHSSDNASNLNRVS